jgi:hypothetical protein
MVDSSLPAESTPVTVKQPRRRMTRNEFWNFVGVAACVWIMVFAFIRIWWRIYLVASQ